MPRARIATGLSNTCPLLYTLHATSNILHSIPFTFTLNTKHLRLILTLRP